MEPVVFYRIIALVVLVIGILILNSMGALAWISGKFVGLIVPRSGSSYATAMATQLTDSPKCTPFKATILEAEKGAQPVGATKTIIVNAYDAASAVGCKKQ